MRGTDGTRVTGARVRDEETGREVTVTADAVVVCAGVWSDLVHEMAGVQAGYQVRMSKGVHIVMPRESVQADSGMIMRTDKSVLFFIPWGERWIVGTTDTEFSGDRAEPAVTEEDVTTSWLRRTGCWRGRWPGPTSSPCTPGCGRWWPAQAG